MIDLNLCWISPFLFLEPVGPGSEHLSLSHEKGMGLLLLIWVWRKSCSNTLHAAQWRRDRREFWKIPILSAAPSKCKVRGETCIAREPAWWYRPFRADHVLCLSCSRGSEYTRPKTCNRSEFTFSICQCMWSCSFSEFHFLFCKLAMIIQWYLHFMRNWN